MTSLQLQEQSNSIINNYSSIFNEYCNVAKNLNETYNSIYLVNLPNTKELHDNYIENNMNLERKIRHASTDVYTNDRKSFYENDALDAIKNYHTLFRWIYFIIVLSFIVSCFLVKTEISIRNRIIILLLLVLYPYIINPVFLWLLNKLYFIASFYPKNVYTSIGGKIDGIPNNQKRCSR